MNMNKGDKEKSSQPRSEPTGLIVSGSMPSGVVGPRMSVAEPEAQVIARDTGISTMRWKKSVWMSMSRSIYELSPTTSSMMKEWMCSK